MAQFGAALMTVRCFVVNREACAPFDRAMPLVRNRFGRCWRMAMALYGQERFAVDCFGLSRVNSPASQPNKG
jgi:hypothetical protein